MGIVVGVLNNQDTEGRGVHHLSRVYILVMEYSTDPECSNHLAPFNIVPVVNYQGAGCTLRGHIYPDYRELMYLFWLYLPPSWISLDLQQTTHSDRLSTTARLLYSWIMTNFVLAMFFKLCSYFSRHSHD